jgi:hypothetical protein
MILHNVTHRVSNLCAEERPGVPAGWSKTCVDTFPSARQAVACRSVTYMMYTRFHAFSTGNCVRIARLRGPDGPPAPSESAALSRTSSRCTCFLLVSVGCVAGLVCGPGGQECIMAPVTPDWHESLGAWGEPLTHNVTGASGRKRRRRHKPRQQQQHCTLDCHTVVGMCVLNSMPQL